MEFGANKALVEVIEEGAFGGKYFRDIYSSVTVKCTKIMERIWSVEKYWSEVLLLKLLWCQCQ